MREPPATAAGEGSQGGQGGPLPRDPSPDLLARKIALLYSLLPAGLATNLVVTLCLVTFLARLAPSRALLAWCLATVVLTLLRLFDWFDYRKRGPGRPRRRRTRIQLSALAQGVLWGAAAWAVFPSSPLDRLFAVIILSGMTGGAVMFLASIWSAYVLYLIPMLVPVSLRLLAAPPGTQRITGLLGLAYLAAMLLASWRTSRWIGEGLKANLVNEELNAHLKAANDRLEAYRASLEDEVRERTGALSRANALLQEEVRQKDAERARAALSEARYRGLLETMNEGFGHVDAEEVFRFVNPAGERIFGAGPGELVGRSLHDYLDPTASARIVQETGLRVRGSSSTYVLEFTRADGRRRSLEVTASPIQDERGAYAGASAMFKDVTEVLASQAALRGSEERNRALLEALPDTILLNSRDGRYLDVHVHDGGDPALLPGPFLHRRIEEVLEPALARRFMEAFEAAITTHAIQLFEYQTPGPAGPAHLEARVVRCNDEMVFTVIRDITEQRRNESAVRQTQKLESLGVLAGGIAHDFNNLLSAIQGNLDLAQVQTAPGSPSRLYLAHMETAIQRASALTRQMLAYSGKGHFEVRDLDLNRAVRELTSLLQVSISKRADLQFDLDEGLPAIVADQAQLQQVIMNLVTNASDALQDRDGRIRISTKHKHFDSLPQGGGFVLPVKAASCVELMVTDTGVGMEPDVQALIFDPFFSTKASGRGLGLSAMLGILRGHGAGLEIESRVGWGSSFRLFFPAGSRSLEPPTAAPPEERRTFQGRVLLVDDEPILLETAMAMCELLGLQVTPARDGLEALACIQGPGGDVDLVLMDLTMPRMDGHQAFEAIHALRPDLPVILSSGYTEQAAQGRPAGLAPAGFLHKPYNLKDLRKVLAAVLGN